LLRKRQSCSRASGRSAKARLQMYLFIRPWHWRTDSSHNDRRTHWPPVKSVSGFLSKKKSFRILFWGFHVWSFEKLEKIIKLNEGYFLNPQDVTKTLQDYIIRTSAILVTLWFRKFNGFLKSEYCTLLRYGCLFCNICDLWSFRKFDTYEQGFLKFNLIFE
jgi:hypothetical protein